MKRLAIVIAAVVCLLVGIVIASGFWLRSDSGRRWVAGEIAALASTPGETEVRIGGLTGDLFGAFGLTDLRVADRRGVWLTVGSAAFDWRPWDLLGGTVTIIRADIRDVAVERRPDTEPSKTETSLAEEIESLRDMPRVRVKALSIAPLTLGEAVLGQKAALRISGGIVAAAGRNVDGQLRIVRLDGAAGEIKLDGRYDVAGETLALDVTAQEPRGGLVARALDVPGHPALKAGLKGEGPISDWKGKVDLSFERTASGRADLTIRHGKETAFEVAGSATLPAGDSDVLRKLASGAHRFRIVGVYGRGDVLTLTEMQLDAKLATLRGSGTLHFDDMTVDATASIEKRGDTRLTLAPSDVSLATLTAQLVAKGKLPLPGLKLTFTAGRVDMPDVAAADIAGTISVDPDGADHGRVTAETTLTALSFTGQAQVAALVGETVSAQGVADLDLASSSVDMKDLRVRTRHAALTGKGRFGWDNGDGAVKASLSAPDLSVLRDLAGTSLGGALVLTADATLRDFGAATSATIGGKVTEFSTGEPVADAVLSRQIDLAAKVEVAGDKVTATDVTLTAGRAKVTGEATLDTAGEAISGTYSAAIAAGDPVPLADGVGLHCACGVEGKLSGTLSAMALSGDLSVGGVRMEGGAFDNIKSGYELSGLPDAPVGSVTLSTGSPVGDLKARTQLALAGDRLKLDDLHVASGAATIGGAVSIPLSGGPVDGKLKFDIRDLTGLLAMAQFDGAGKVSGTATLKAESERQVAEAAATAEQLRFRSAPDAPIIAVGRATLKLAAADLLKGDRNTLDLRLEKGSAGDLSLATLSGRAAGSLDRLTLSMQAKGDWRGPLTVDAAGEYAVEKDTPSITVSKLRGTVIGKTLSLRGATRISWGEAGYSVTPIDLTYGKATLRGHARSGHDGVDVSIKLDDLPLATVDPFWPLGIKGDVDATLAVKGAWPNPPGSFRIAAPGLKVDQAPDTPALSVDIAGDWRKGRLAVDGRLKAGDAAPSAITASLPLRLDGPAVSVTVPPDQPVSGRLEWSGETAALWRFSPLTEHLLRGDGKIDVRLSGTAAKPNLQGSLALNDGYYESLEYGTVLKPLNLAIRFDGQRARITRLDAGDGSGGKVEGKGALTFDAAADFPFNLALKLAALTAVRRDDVQASATGDISIDGSFEAAKVKSKLTTDRVEIRILDRLPPEVATLDVVEIGRLGKVEKKEKKENPLADNIELAISVEMPRRVFVRGRGIDSEWKGDLTVTGRADAPRVAGTIDLVRGQLTVVGKTFTMESGKVVLPERADAEPNLSLVAAYSGRNLTVRAHVNGPISKPAITLSSVPSLPQDEIVSQVLFDKSSSRLSAFEAAQLALALTELAGKGGSGGILDFARKTLGVDVLQIESVETSNGAKPVVGAGKYLTDDVYVGVKQGASPETSSIGVEVEVTPNVFLESDVRRSGESDVGVKFKYDY